MDKILKKMIDNAYCALENSYAPYSQFSVASCIYTSKKKLYTGVNVENASYGLTMCAEASAICAMVSAGETEIEHVVVLAGSNQLCSPCGSCRQRLFEFSKPNTLVHLCSKDTVLRSVPIDELLPLAFKFNPVSG